MGVGGVAEAGVVRLRFEVPRLRVLLPVVSEGSHGVCGAIGGGPDDIGAPSAQFYALIRREGGDVGVEGDVLEPLVPLHGVDLVAVRLERAPYGARSGEQFQNNELVGFGHGVFL